MKKLTIYMLSAIMIGITILPKTHLYAIDFASDESGWLERCKVPQSTAAKARECAQFAEYYADKSKGLEGEVADLNGQIAKLKGSIDGLQDTINKQQKLIDKLNKSIDLNNATIRTLQGEIRTLAGKIELKEKDIAKRNDLITKRMLDEQANIGTSVNVEIIMGANDLIDMIRRVEGLQRITDSDQDDIKKLDQEKKELDLQRKEQVRLKNDAETKKAENVKNQKSAQDLQNSRKAALKEYLKHEAELNQKMRSAKVNMNDIKSNIININTSVAGDMDFNGKGLMKPTQGPTGANTWFYPGGGVHLGWDISPSVGTPIRAPGDGIIVYANNPIGTNDGFLGNYVGHPFGGGNTIHMITRSNGVTYGISFFHMAQENFLVSPGQKVKKGQQLGSVGGSGNVTGPHLHVEVVNLGKMSIQSAISTFQKTADFAWGCNWDLSALSRTCSVSGPPCRERPEEIFD